MAEKIGQGAIDFTIQVKGAEFAMHDPRGKVAVGLGYAVCEYGADHLVGIHDPALVNPESFTFKAAKLISDQVAPLPARELSEQKAAQYLIFEKWVSAGKTFGLCFFGPAPRSYLLLPDILEAIRAASGWELTAGDLLEIGERGTNLARIFNLREGFTPADDTLPARMFEPLENGPLAGTRISREDFARALDKLYALKGWDRQTGIPSRDKLAGLGLDWAGALLAV
jgi:aldehyde:ferredoxin oxidoreductase